MRVSSGTGKTILLRLTQTGLLLLANATKHRLQVRAAATLTGGNAASGKITLQLKPKHHHHP